MEDKLNELWNAIITNPKVGLVPAHINQIGHFLGR